MLFTNTILAASWKPQVKVIQLANQNLNVLLALKANRKTNATLKTIKFITTVIFSEYLSYILPRTILPIISPTPRKHIARSANFTSFEYEYSSPAMWFIKNGINIVENNARL